MRLHSTNFPERDFPLGQRRVFQEWRELVVRDRLNLRADERSGLADLREKILQLAHAREVIGIRAVLRELERGVMKKALDFHVERFFKLEARRQRRGRFAEAALPVGNSRIRLLKPGEVFRPFVSVDEKMGEIPFVGVWEVGAGENLCGGHSMKRGKTSNVQRPTSNVEL